MSTINNQTKGLFAIDSVEDLSHDSAAAIQGGIFVWDGANFTGPVRDLQASRNLVAQGFNDKISSIRNNTRRTWEFFTNANFTGSRLTVRPGQSLGNLGPTFNNKISSMRSI
ncbi:MAG: peptidase inhibitor family I36 protein [Nitrososphaera sp.]|nr:peptidase inhibitor family I36 protein [Nitrososphaera sp.]